ncbi:YraN family protein [Cohnella mopanensis]|uniref:YraN family protein n=1 Tax=Cohnella mopanensis TaxID=2911966 RepID=UPI001EF791C8|nr:YraN family protein [Cohnella mopanensis]
MEETPSSSSLAKNRRAAVGKAGEDVAARHLQRSGYVVKERNWRCRSGELDLVALDGETLVFVEVRSRSDPSRFGTAVEAITPRKCRQVREVAIHYLKQCQADFRPIRFDVVAVTFGKDGSVLEVKHLQGAF